MPTYEYKCNCGYTEVIMHSIKKELKPVCPECGDLLVKQVGTGGCTRYIGEGFHCNDYKDKNESE